jgi:hypothetical protein
MKKMFQKAINIAVAKGIIKPVTPKSKPKTEKKTTTNKTKTSTVSKNNNTKVGISKSILNQSNLLKKKSTTKKKTLLGG